MELFFRRLHRAFEKLFGFSFFVGIIVVIFVFSGFLLLNFKRIGAFFYVYKGDKFCEKRMYQEAINYYQHALELFPAHVKARYNLGNIYAAYEDFDSAIECYQNTILYAPNYINARINLGIILAEERAELDVAIEEYIKAVNTKIPLIKIPFIYNNYDSVKNSKAIAYYNMGLAYRDKSLLYDADSIESKELLYKASDAYSKSLDINPLNYNAQYNSALTYHLLNLYSEAIGGYCNAMLIEPLNYEAYYNLAVLLRQKGKYAEAADEFKRAGNLSSYEGSTSKAAFIYQVLNEVSTMAIAQHGYEPEKIMDRLDTDVPDKYEEEDNNYEERALTTEELEKVLANRLKTKSICKAYFEDK